MRRVLLALTLVLLFPGVARAAPLTNTAHLDFLGATVVPPAQPGHTTYRAGEPLGVLWTYADRQADGSYNRVGGGKFDAATNTYGQGAFNADDIARAAVVYLRHWRATGSSASRARAVGLLRGLTYLQSPNGNVVLWMQPDGTLNVSADPPETPSPSDSDASYWLARTVWALGEGYSAFKRDDPAFARFLRDRLDLAIGALDREVLDAYPRTQVVDGRTVPAWLIVDGADATAEAMLGLTAYVDAGGTPAARRALAQFGEGVAALGTRKGSDPLSGGDSRGLTPSALTWPYGAVLPWALSRSIWHAWGSQMPAALAGAAVTLGRDDLLSPALADAASFTPHLLVAAGPGERLEPDADRPHADRLRRRQPAPERARRGRAARRPGLRRLAGCGGRVVLRQQPGGRADVRPGHGRDVRRRLRRRRRSTATAAPSRRSTGCSRCSRSTPPPTWRRRRAWRSRSPGTRGGCSRPSPRRSAAARRS